MLYKSRIFPCRYKCGFYGKTPAGVTQHGYSCAKNLQNHYSPLETRAPSSHPHTPSPRPNTGNIRSPGEVPHTPHHFNHGSNPTTPQQSPRRFQWTTNWRGIRTCIHPYLDGGLISFLGVNKVVITKILLGRPCDVDGDDLPEGSPPPPPTERAKDDYYPYQSRADFELADFLFRKDQMSGKKVSELMDIWAAYQQN